MFKPLRTLALAAVALSLAAGSFAQSRTKLTIYSALENEQLAPFKAAIERAVPEAEVEWVRDSTGVITARFLAEKDNPKADMVLGLAASSMLLFEQANLLEAYTPAGSEQLRAAPAKPGRHRHSSSRALPAGALVFGGHATTVSCVGQ